MVTLPWPSGAARRSGDERVRRWGALVARASRPVDPASLAVVRIAFGLVGVLVAVRTIANGWVEELYAGPRHHFTYAGFGWVHPPSPAGTYALVAVIGIAAALVALGWHTRVALVVFLLAFGWLELIDVTTYLNHYWFVTLFAIVLLAVPAAACWSLDARRGRGARAAVPLGALVLVRAQVGVVYVFAGLAKLHTDWLVHAVPLRIWLPTHADMTIVGPWLAEPWVALALSWAGAAFDLLVVPALCYRRTRPFAWAAVVVFHVATWRLFPMIGVFPWLMIAVSTAFFAPDWPRRLGTWARRGSYVASSARPTARDGDARATRLPTVVVAVGLVWIAMQVLLPLRQCLVPGDARWTNEGYRFAWTVLATEKGGRVSFRVHDPATNRTWITDATNLYTERQWRAMATEPELIRQAAHQIATEQARKDRAVEVRADAFVSLNGRPAARLVDPTVDLAREPYRIHQPWILPMPDTETLVGR
jgi:hypothetical protein